MRRPTYLSRAAFLVLTVMMVACAPEPPPDTTQNVASPTPTKPVAPPAVAASDPASMPVVDTASLPTLSEEESDEITKGMVAGKSYHIDLQFRDKLHLWRVRFDGQQVIGSDGHPTLMLGIEGPAVFGEAGTGPLRVDPVVEGGWRWKQDKKVVEVWKDDMRYHGTLSGNRIEGEYVEGDEEGTFVMTLAE